jgi:exodeoxyribonuclease-3
MAKHLFPDWKVTSGIRLRGGRKRCSRGRPPSQSAPDLRKTQFAIALLFSARTWHGADVIGRGAPRLRIATWNVNSIRQRLPHLLDYLKETSPDVLCLQEIKCLDDQFPRMEIEELGYNIETHGQKTFNGVAILSRRPFEVARGLPGDENDSQSRYLEAVVPAQDGVVRVASIYLPNGNPVDSEKYPYKLIFMERLIAHARKLMQYEEPLVLAGDFNVIPDARDAAHPEQWVNDALFLPQTRMKYRELMALGLTDALRATTDAGGLYTFWDYQAGGWQKNNGIRIDHLMLSPQAADRLRSVAIDKAMRGRDKASDHTPIRVDLAL